MNAAAAPFHLRRVDPADAPSVTACVEAAYQPWIACIGRKPAPMLDDYAEVIHARDDVTVAVDDAGHVIGVVVLQQMLGGMLLENVAVVPAAQGHSVGNALLQRTGAAAPHMGHASLYLHTNERMTENVAFYRRTGYVEYARAEQHGHRRAFLRKMRTAS